MLKEKISHKHIKLLCISRESAALRFAVTLGNLLVKTGVSESHQPHLQQSRFVSCLYSQMAHNMDKIISEFYMTNINPKHRV